MDLVIGLERLNIVHGLHALHQIDYHMSIPLTPEEFAEPDRRKQWQNDKGMVVLKLWSDAHRRTPMDVFIFEPFDLSVDMDQVFAAVRCPADL